MYQGPHYYLRVQEDLVEVHVQPDLSLLLLVVRLALLRVRLLAVSVCLLLFVLAFPKAKSRFMPLMITEFRR